MVLVSSLMLGLQTLCAQDVPTSLAWDVAAAPRHAALGGLDVAPLEADGWSVAVHPCALDSTVERDLYTSYLDFFAGIRAGAVTWWPSVASARPTWASVFRRSGHSKAPPPQDSNQEISLAETTSPSTAPPGPWVRNGLWGPQGGQAFGTSRK